MNKLITDWLDKHGNPEIERSLTETWEDINPRPRHIDIWTGKGGAIMLYMAIFDMTEPSEEEKDVYRKKLEDELKEGTYRIDSHSGNLIEYLG